MDLLTLPSTALRAVSFWLGEFAKGAAKPGKCMYCDSPATHGVRWAEGMARIPVDQRHLAKAKATVHREEGPGGIVGVDEVKGGRWVNHIGNYASVQVDESYVPVLDLDGATFALYGMDLESPHAGDPYGMADPAHASCGIDTFCRNPLHPGPCKGWKHMLHSVSPAAYHKLEQARVEKLNAARKAKIAALEAAGKKVPSYLKKPVTYKQVPDKPEGMKYTAPTPEQAKAALPPTMKQIEANLKGKHAAKSAAVTHNPNATTKQKVNQHLLLDEGGMAKLPPATQKKIMDDLVKITSDPAAPDDLKKAAKDKYVALMDVAPHTPAPKASNPPGYLSDKDGDGDGKVYDGTPWEKSAKAERAKAAAGKIESKSAPAGGKPKAQQDVENLADGGADAIAGMPPFERAKALKTLAAAEHDPGLPESVKAAAAKVLDQLGEKLPNGKAKIAAHKIAAKMDSGTPAVEPTHPDIADKIKGQSLSITDNTKGLPKEARDIAPSGATNIKFGKIEGGKLYDADGKLVGTPLHDQGEKAKGWIHVKTSVPGASGGQRTVAVWKPADAMAAGPSTPGVPEGHAEVHQAAMDAISGPGTPLQKVAKLKASGLKTAHYESLPAAQKAKLNSFLIGVKNGKGPLKAKVGAVTMHDGWQGLLKHHDGQQKMAIKAVNGGTPQGRLTAYSKLSAEQFSELHPTFREAIEADLKKLEKNWPAAKGIAAQLHGAVEPTLAEKLATFHSPNTGKLTKIATVLHMKPEEIAQLTGDQKKTLADELTAIKAGVHIQVLHEKVDEALAKLVHSVGTSNAPAGASPVKSKVDQLFYGGTGVKNMDKVGLVKGMTPAEFDALPPEYQQKIITTLKDLNKTAGWGIHVIAAMAAIGRNTDGSKKAAAGPTHGHGLTPHLDATAQTAKPATAGPTGALTKLPGSIGSTHGAYKAKDAAGKEWVVKPKESGKGMIPYAEAGVSQLANEVGLTTPHVQIQPDGSTVQEWVPGSKPAFPGGFDPKSLSAADILAIQKHHVLDWLTGQHDAHSGNWLKDADGKLVEIDKGQAFKFYASDKLTASYHPNQMEKPPIYNALVKAAGNGDIKLNDPNSGKLGAFIKDVQALPDDKIKAMFKPYADAAKADGMLPGGGTVDGFLSKVIERKNKLGQSFTDLHNANGIGHAPKLPDVPAQAATQGHVAHGKGKFEILADTGANGDGHITLPGGGKGPWGKYGASGVMIKAPGPDGKPRYLLVQRGPTSSTNKGKWQLPGGALDSKENAHQGAARETNEELGASPAYLAKLESHESHVYEGPAGWKYTSIAATHERMFDPVVDGTETGAAKWFTAEELAKLDTDGKLIPALSGGALQKNVMSLYPDAPSAPDIKITEMHEVTQPAAPGLTDHPDKYIKNTLEVLAGTDGEDYSPSQKLYFIDSNITPIDYDGFTPEQKELVKDALKEAGRAGVSKAATTAQHLGINADTPAPAGTVSAVLKDPLEVLHAGHGVNTLHDYWQDVDKHEFDTLPESDKVQMQQALVNGHKNGTPTQKANANDLHEKFFGAPIPGHGAPAGVHPDAKVALNLIDTAPALKGTILTHLDNVSKAEFDKLDLGDQDKIADYLYDLKTGGASTAEGKTWAKNLFDKFKPVDSGAAPHVQAPVTHATSADLSAPHVKDAVNWATNKGPGMPTAAKHVKAYGKLTPEEFHALAPEHQATILDHLAKAKEKFLSPAKKAEATAVLDKLTGPVSHTAPAVPVTPSPALATSTEPWAAGLAAHQVAQVNALAEMAKGAPNLAHYTDKQKVAGYIKDVDTADLHAYANAIAVKQFQVNVAAAGLNETDVPDYLTLIDQLKAQAQQAVMSGDASHGSAVTKLKEIAHQVNQSGKVAADANGYDESGDAIGTYKGALFAAQLQAEMAKHANAPHVTAPAGAGGHTTAPNIAPVPDGTPVHVPTVTPHTGSYTPEMTHAMTVFDSGAHEMEKMQAMGGLDGAHFLGLSPDDQDRVLALVEKIHDSSTKAAKVDAAKALLDKFHPAKVSQLGHVSPEAYNAMSPAEQGKHVATLEKLGSSPHDPTAALAKDLVGKFQMAKLAQYDGMTSAQFLAKPDAWQEQHLHEIEKLSQSHNPQTAQLAAQLYGKFQDPNKVEYFGLKFNKGATIQPQHGFWGKDNHGQYTVKAVVQTGQEADYQKYLEKLDNAVSGQAAHDVPTHHLATMQSKADGGTDKEFGNLSTKSVAAAIYQYSQSSTTMNRIMRALKGKLPDPKDYDTDAEKKAAKAVQAIDKGMKKFRTTEDVVMMRGFNAQYSDYDAGTSGNVFEDSWSTSHSLVDAEWTDPAFGSTSTQHGTARNFSGGGDTSIVMRLFIPKGTPMVAMDTASHFSGESEILLGRNTKYRVVADHGYQNGKRMLDVEVVPG